MTVPPVNLIPAPDHGVWRLGWAVDPIRFNQVEPETFSGSAAGRFSLFSFGMLYCASAPTGCYAEALAYYRVDPKIRALMSDAEPSSDVMGIGQLPSSWRQDRLLVRLDLAPGAQFLDVDSETTRKILADALHGEFSKWNVTGPLTDDHIHGKDRRIARQIAAWAVAQRNDDGHQLIQGIAYRSGYGGRQCWAILRDTEVHEVERRTIQVEDPDLQEVAREYGLTIR
ncbi:RES domain-containing protein [Streptomyces goshikiensis]|uniref:RES domain-containing protein n=1 Tax=Streptomyces goshikiensis TaxID=1942 RepID=UPI0036F60DD4